jgi:hypothetical protein
MTRTARMMGLCLFSTIGTTMLLGCSGVDPSPESVKQLTSGGGGSGGGRAPLGGLAAGTSGAGASAGGAAAGAAASAPVATAGGAGVGAGGAGGAGVGGAGVGGAAGGGGSSGFGGFPYGGRDSFTFGGFGGSVLRIDGSGGTDTRIGWELGGTGGLRIKFAN